MKMRLCFDPAAGLRNRKTGAVFAVCIVAALSVSEAFSENDRSTVHHRVVSLGPAVTESIYLLGAETKLVADTTYCTHPPAAAKKPKAGTVLSADIERIVKLKPDLVIGIELTDKRQLAKMRDMGLRVVVFDQPKSFAEICAQFVELGRLLGREREALEITEAAKRSVKETAVSAAKAEGRPSVFVQIGSRPLFTVSSDSFISEYIYLAGGRNSSPVKGSGQYSIERVVRDDPDIIMIVDMGIASAAEKMEWKKRSSMKAARSGRIFLFDSYRICSPTPPVFAATLKELASLFAGSASPAAAGKRNGRE